MDTALLPDPREGGLSSELPKARLEKAVRLFSSEKRKESAGAGLLLARILPRFLASAEEVYADERGKLLHPRLYLSLAHGGGMAVLVVGDRPVGCDVEKFSRVREGVLRRFLKEERAFVREAAGERAREGAFYRIWTGKESYLKRTGEGLSAWKEVRVLPEGLIWRAGKEQPCRIVWKEAGEHLLALCHEEEAASWEEVFF